MLSTLASREAQVKYATRGGTCYKGRRLINQVCKLVERCDKGNRDDGTGESTAKATGMSKKSLQQKRCGDFVKDFCLFRFFRLKGRAMPSSCSRNVDFSEWMR